MLFYSAKDKNINEYPGVSVTKHSTTLTFKVRILHSLEFPPEAPHFKEALKNDFGSFFHIAMQYHLGKNFVYQRCVKITLATDKEVVEALAKASSYNKPVIYLPITYAWLTEQEILQKPIPFEFKINKAVLFVSNCHSEGRNAYVNQLMEHMPGLIDSYGGCWTNADQNSFSACNGGRAITGKNCIIGTIQ